MTATAPTALHLEKLKQYCSQSRNDLGEETNYDYGFRDYSPVSMMFTTVDPIKDSFNWYAYVGNDPINFIDLWGLEMSLLVDKDTQIMTVIVTNYDTTITKDIKITTGVVSQNPEPNTDTSRTQTRGSDTTNPTQFPNGTHKVASSDDNPTGNDKYGDTWLVTDAKQDLKDVNTDKTVTDDGYNVHLTPHSNTNGCIGVKKEEDMDWLADQFEKNEIIDPGSTTITVQGGTTSNTSSLKNK